MEDLYKLITWPEIQKYMEIPGFNENSYLAIDDEGSSDYFVSLEWLQENGL